MTAEFDNHKIIDLLELTSELKREFSTKMNTEFETKILFGAELEFYINSDDVLNLKSERIKIFYSKLKEYCQKENIPLENLEEEEGLNQFEIQFYPTENPNLICQYIDKSKNIISKIENVSFAAKPNINQPGNSIHFHISAKINDINLFDKNPDDKDFYFDVFYWSIGGLLETMNDFIHIFCPTKECLKRLKAPTTSAIHKSYPTNCSWGFDNRTCAIRIVKGPMRRIEHRLSSPLCNAYNVLRVIIFGMLYGLKNELNCQDPTYGDAFDIQYDLPSFLIKNCHYM